MPQSLSLLEIRKTLSADPQSVFDALTQPELMNQWFYAMDDGSAKVEMDLVPGGNYSVAMINPAGENVATPYGEILEVDPPNKLSMTWKTDGFVDHSILTFSLKPTNEGTEITIRHELPEATIEAHTGGWNTCMSNLEKALS